MCNLEACNKVIIIVIVIIIIIIIIWTYGRHPYPALITGQPWVSSVSYLDKRDRELLGVHCIAFGKKFLLHSHFY